MEPQLKGLHHVTAVTANAKGNLAFYTRTLGMRLVKKTVNQDDVSAYHLFYADGLGSPGTDFTFFDWAHVPAARQGAGTVSETALRVLGGTETLQLWSRWFDENQVSHGPIDTASDTGFSSLPFQDPEGQRLRLVAEPRTDGEFHPWRGSPVPREAAIVGLSAVTLSIREVESTARFLEHVLGFRSSRGDSSVLEVGAGGPGARLRLIASSGYGTSGAGGVHHVAWAVADAEEQFAWLERLRRHRVATSGIIDRFYFQSIYFRIPGEILFELATQGPGFTADGEDIEHLGETLSLPPFLEPRRERIEAGLKPLESLSGEATSP